MFEVDYLIAQEFARMIDRDKPEGQPRPSLFARLLAKVRQQPTQPQTEDFRFGAVSFSKADDQAVLPQLGECG